MCIDYLQTRAEDDNTDFVTCPYRYDVTTPADVYAPKNYPQAATLERHEQQKRHRMAALLKCVTDANSLALMEVAMVIEMCQLEAESPIEGSIVNRGQGVFLTRWMGGNKKSLRSLYRASHDGPSHAKLLRCVGDANGLVFVVKKGERLFGAFISAGIQLPDDPTGENEYRCDVWHFSLAGHFAQPTKFGGVRQPVGVAGREGLTAEGLEKLWNCPWLYLGCEGGAAADDMRSCYQFIYSGCVPEGYVGPWSEYGNAAFGGRATFMADDVEVLTVV
ncbi:unnamed protein product [Vitrella brassicaformis CCMP3155]|uniref:TLDc domain-containing protein n=1 Tax=Vitrella brassicaformis (strain CCMP3155) TaxID=1169540 RepID=A0A0G4GD35_VITBC|nr:unnamed protein product [Vitrella brassicaformis CCMP3155]|eukprot:CEM27169.1 unnamed protein product [Vitrella brassicaformis CCMP3155]